RDREHCAIDTLGQVVDGRHTGPSADLRALRVDEVQGSLVTSIVKIGKNTCAKRAGCGRSSDEGDGSWAQQAVHWFQFAHRSLLAHFYCYCKPEDFCECRFSWKKTAIRPEASGYTHSRNALTHPLNQLAAASKSGVAVLR